MNCFINYYWKEEWNFVLSFVVVSGLVFFFIAFLVLRLTSSHIAIVCNGTTDQRSKWCRIACNWSLILEQRFNHLTHTRDTKKKCVRSKLNEVFRMSFSSSYRPLPRVTNYFISNLKMKRETAINNNGMKWINIEKRKQNLPDFRVIFSVWRALVIYVSIYKYI